MKTITKSLSLMLISIMILTIPMMGQERPQKNRQEQMEKMKSMKIAFITDNMELTTSEAEKFWPIYNEYEKKREMITEGLMERFEKKEENTEKISDDEADKTIRMRFENEQELLDLKTEYYEKYLDVLSASRVLKLFEVENNFRRHLMGRMGRGGDAPQDRRGQERTPEGKGVAPPCKERGHRR